MKKRFLLLTLSLLLAACTKERINEPDPSQEVLETMKKLEGIWGIAEFNDAKYPDIRFNIEFMPDGTFKGIQNSGGKYSINGNILSTHAYNSVHKELIILALEDGKMILKEGDWLIKYLKMKNYDIIRMWEIGEIKCTEYGK